MIQAPTNGNVCFNPIRQSTTVNPGTFPRRAESGQVTAGGQHDGQHDAVHIGLVLRIEPVLLSTKGNTVLGRSIVMTGSRHSRKSKRDVCFAICRR